MSRNISMYTDGACKYNPGPGGYACIIVENDEETIFTGFEPKTTNNRMEMMGIIIGLESIKERANIVITTDSKYVCNAYNLGWIDNWKKNGWINTRKFEVLNKDLWLRLCELTEFHNVSFSWIKGHNGHPYNERCDRLAVESVEKGLKESEKPEYSNFLVKQVIKKDAINIYLDNAASTMISPSVQDEIVNGMKQYWANPSSMYNLGYEAKTMMESCRLKIGKLLNCSKEEIYFTSSGTESANMAIEGVAYANSDKGKHIVCSSIEHACVIETCKKLESRGFDVTYVNPDKNGEMKVRSIVKEIRDDTILVCVMHVNNEIGTINDIKTIAKKCHEKGVILFSDGVSAVPYLEVDLDDLGVDLYSFSGHKINAPSGIGVLFIKNGIKVEPFITGGGQERGIRSGTENVPYIMGITKALESLYLESYERLRVFEMKKYIKQSILNFFDDVQINGGDDDSFVGIINVSFKGIMGESIVMKMKENGIYLSTGAACHSINSSNQYVLSNMGIDKRFIDGTIRISISRNNKMEECQEFVETLKEVVDVLKNMRICKL